MKELLLHTFSFLIDSGFKTELTKKGKEQVLTFSKEDAELQVSWTSEKEKPSINYSDDIHLFGILDCEKEIRAKHKDLPEKQQELLAWIFSVMPLKEFLELFAQKIRSTHE